MAEDKQEEKIDFTAEGEDLGYISMAQARLLAMGTGYRSQILPTSRWGPGGYWLMTCVIFDDQLKEVFAGDFPCPDCGAPGGVACAPTEPRYSFAYEPDLAHLKRWLVLKLFIEGWNYMERVRSLYRWALTDGVI